MTDDHAPVWMPLNEAALRLGISSEAVRARIRRGQLESRRGNDGRVSVLVSAPTPAEPAMADERAAIERLLTDLDEARGDADYWRTLAELRSVEVATAKGEAAAAEARAEAQAAAHERVAAELQSALEWHRRPWWRRWIG
jgi:hypothetical protein